MTRLLTIARTFGSLIVQRYLIFLGFCLGLAVGSGLGFGGAATSCVTLLKSKGLL